ncbi:MAG: YfhO family protein [Flavobacteriales bacterium]|nr:YfhO family protein [Flavobacteriales bacterium]
MKDMLFKAIPHTVAVLVFVILSSVFFSPAYDGHDLRQGDIAQFLGMSKEIRDYREFYEEETLWTNSMFGGMPSYQISLLQTRNVPKMIFTAIRTAFPGPVGTVFLAMLSFYILGLCLRVNPWLAMIGGVAFGFSSVHILYLAAGHASKINAIALMPGVLGGVLLAYRGKMFLGASVAALFLAMHLSANHLQMTYYLIYLIAFAGIAEIIRLAMKGEMGSAIKASGMLVIGAILAVLPNLTNILTTYEYSKYSTRGDSELTVLPPAIAEIDPNKEINDDGLEKDYILEYSMARGEFWSMMVPNIKGGAAGAIGNDRDLLKVADSQFRENVAQSNRYWGEQNYTGGAFYFGALIMALFIASLFVLKDPLKWAFLLLSILAIILSWRTASGLTDFFIDNVPLFGKFRDTKMMLVVISIMAPTMSILLIDELIKGLEDKRKKWLFIGMGAAVLPLILFMAAPNVMDFISPMETAQFKEAIIQSNNDFQMVDFIDGLQESLVNVRQKIMLKDIQRSLLIILLGFAILVVLTLKKLDYRIAIAVLGVIIIGDIYNVDRRYLNNEKKAGQYLSWQKTIDKQFPYMASQADQMIFDLEIQKNPELASIVRDAVEDFQKTAKVKYFADLRSNEKEMATIKVQQSAQFGMFNLNTNFRVLNIRNPFNDARTSYFHKSLGGYHGAKLGRYNELVEFYMRTELQRFLESANTIGAAALQNMEIANMLNAQYLILDPNGQPLPNPNANGNVWFVKDVEFVDSANEEMESMEIFDSKVTAIVHNEFKNMVPVAITPDSTAVIEMTEYKPNMISYRSNASTKQLAVFSEIWYPKGWLAYVDGIEQPIIRANYVLRGLALEPGEHEIEFVFDPAVYHSGQICSLVGSILLLMFVGGTGFMAYRRQETPEAA